MKKSKRILAIIGIVLLVGMYVVTLIAAITDNSNTMGLFRASIYITVVVPVIIWAYTYIVKLATKGSDDSIQKKEEEKETDKSN